MVRLLRQAKKQIPGDLTASGLLNAEFRATRGVPNVPEDARTASAPPRGDARLSAARQGLLQPLSQTWTGNGSATNVRLSSNAGKDEFAFGTIPLVLVGADSRGASQGRRPSHPGYEEQNDRSPLNLTCGLGRSHWR